MLQVSVEMVSGLLKSISHPLRLGILCLLQDEELTVGQLHDALQTSNANITQHLNILRHQGIVGSRKESNFIYNYISDQRILKLMQALQDIYC